MRDADLRPDQLASLAQLAARDRAIYVAPPGAGKSATSSRWLSGSSLVICPANVRNHWIREIARWTDTNATRGWGTPKRRERARWHATDGGVLVINYESFRQDVDALVKLPWQSVVFDEAHRLRGRDTLLHKSAAKLARRVPRLLFVTGTPVLNRAEELWSYLHMLDPKQYPSFWRWAREHFMIEQTTFWGRLPRPITLVHDLKPGAAAVIREQIAEFLVEGPGPDLPDVIETIIDVDLSPAERKLYDSMVTHNWLQTDDGTVVQAINEVAKITRLRQLVSGWEQVGSDSKVKAAIELATDLEPEQVVILTAYRESADRLGEALRCPVIHGGVDLVRRDLRMAEFKSGTARCLVGTLATIGEGTDGLQVARHVVLLDRDWTPARNEQAIGRIRRSGQQSRNLCAWHVVARDTVDQTVAEALARKTDVIQAVLGGTANAVH